MLALAAVIPHHHLRARDPRLRDRGVLTEAEFEAQKRKIIGRTPS
jgi:Short C-terminal domain